MTQEEKKLTIEDIINKKPDLVTGSYDSVVKVFDEEGVVLKEMKQDILKVRNLFRNEIDFLRKVGGSFPGVNTLRTVNLIDYDYDNCKLLLEKLDVNNNLMDLYIQDSPVGTERNLNILSGGMIWLANLHNLTKATSSHANSFISNRLPRLAILGLNRFRGELDDEQFSKLYYDSLYASLSFSDDITLISGDPSPSSFVMDGDTLIGYDFNATEQAPKEIDLGKYLHGVVSDCLYLPDGNDNKKDFLSNVFSDMLDKYESIIDRPVDYNLVSTFYAFSLLQKYSALGEALGKKYQTVRKLFITKDRESFIDTVALGFYN